MDILVGRDRKHIQTLREVWRQGGTLLQANVTVETEKEQALSWFDMMGPDWGAGLKTVDASCFVIAVHHTSLASWKREGGNLFDVLY